MKIKSINIGSFGKLKNFSLSFCDGLNTVFGENENGKTTICEFIKIMFYGSRGKSSDISKNPREKYAPWSGEKMCGSIDFEHGDINYRLERSFGKSNATDKITIINLDEFESVALSGKEGIGERFFGITEEAFEKSVYIDSSVRAIGKSDELNAKLSNVATSGDDEISYGEVSRRLLLAKEKILSKSERTGSYKKNELRHEELEKELSDGLEADKKRSEFDEKIAKTESEISRVSELKNQCFQNIKTAVLQEKKRKLKEFLPIAEEYERAERLLRKKDGEVADQSFIDLCCRKQSDIKDAERSVEYHRTELKRAYEQLSKPSEVLNENLSALERKKSQIEAKITENEKQRVKAEEDFNFSFAKKRKMKVLSVFAFALAAAFILLGVLFKINYIFIAVGAAAVAIGALIVCFSPSAKQIEQNKNTILEIAAKTEKLTEKISDTQKEIADFEIRQEANRKIENENRKNAAERSQNAENEEKRLENLKEDFLKLFSLYNDSDNYDGAVAEFLSLKKEFDNFSGLKSRMEYASKTVGCFCAAEAKEKLDAIVCPDSPEFDRAELEKEFSELSDYCDKLKSDLADTKNSVAAKFSAFRPVTQIEHEISILETEMREQKAYCDALSFAYDRLENIFQRQRRNFGGQMEEKMHKILSGITGKKYNTLTVNKEFAVTLADGSDINSHSVDYLSCGTADQVYFSLRLALSEMLSSEEKLPIVLDDVFSQYDDKRLLCAVEFLKEYSENSQVIFFTCHNDTKNILERCGSSVLTIED